MKSLIFINDAFFGGGAEKSMRILLENLPKKRKVNYELIVLEAKNNFKIINWCKKRNIKILFLSNTYNIFILKIFQLIFMPILIAWKLRNRKNITILSFQNRSNYISIFCRLILYIDKLIISERNYSSKFFEKGINGFINRKLIRFLYPLSDKIITNSKESKNDLRDNFLIDQSKLIVINNGYDFREIRTKALKNSKDMKILISKNLDKDIFVTVARLEKQKGYLRLIDAISIYKTLTKRSFIWLVIGDGSLLEILKKYSEFKSLKDNVQFLGFKEDPLPYINSANLFLFGSYYEGFPNALAEAVILNKTIISFNFKSGLNEVIKGYPNATSIDTNSSYDFAIEMKKRLKQKITKFEPTYNVNKLIEEYTKVLIND